jgi:hypothetical protein
MSSDCTNDVSWNNSEVLIVVWQAFICFSIKMFHTSWLHFFARAQAMYPIHCHAIRLPPGLFHVFEQNFKLGT